VCILSSTGNVPTNTTYFNVIVTPGTSGTSGTSGAVGTSGTSGAVGATGGAGTSGTSGATGALAGAAFTMTLSGDASKTLSGLSPGVTYNVVANLIQNTTAGDFEIQFNGDTGANYNWSSLGDYTVGDPGSYVGAGANYIAPLHYSTVYPSVGTYIVIKSFLTTKYGDNKTVIINGKGTWYNNQISTIANSDFSGSYVGGSSLSSITIGTSAGTLTGTVNIFVVGQGQSGTSGATGTSGASGTSGAGAFPYVKVSEVQSSGTAGGTFTSGSYVTRVLNTKDTDTGSIATLSSNQITLPAGTYQCRISAPAFACSGNKAVLYNVTDSTITLLGTPQFALNLSNCNSTISVIVGSFTIATSKTFAVQHRCASTQNTNGLGYPAGFGDNEVYTVAEFWKVA
jgi:hypothetical protein